MLASKTAHSNLPILTMNFAHSAAHTQPQAPPKD
jgi:hypothetical protein